jgi:hypothetical protein
MIIKRLVDVQIEHNVIKMLCECDNDEYKVIETHLDFNSVKINHERDVGPDGSIVKDKCDIIIPVKMDDGNYTFNIREWK